MSTKEKRSYKAFPLPDQHEMSNAETEGAARVFRDYMRLRHTVRDYPDRPVRRALIEHCISAGGTAPSGANYQPRHFVAISDPGAKHKIREAAEKEERRFYDGGAVDEWLQAREPNGIGAEKPHLETAPPADRCVRPALR